MWDKLEIGWQSAFDQSWSAYKRGANPIGCSIVNAKNEVVASGQNRTHDVSAPEKQIYSNTLAHAEINAMLQIDSTEHIDKKSYTLYTTYEPCIQCFGAFYLSGINNLIFAARDPSGGSTNIIGKTEYLKKKRVSISGPIASLEALHIVFRYDWALKKNLQSVIDKENILNPIASEVGRMLSEDGTIEQMKESDEPVRTVVLRIIEKLKEAGVRGF